MALKLEPKKRDGETVLLRFAYTNKTRKYFSTGVIIPLSDFKSGVLQKPVRSSNPNAAHLNRLVEQVYSKLMSIQSQLLREDKVPTADLVHHLYNKVETVTVEPQHNTMLSVSFERFLKSSGYEARTEKLYNTLYSHLITCFGDFPMIEFTLDHWVKFTEYLRKENKATKKKKLSANTICIRLAKFKHFIKFLQEEGSEVKIEKFPMPKEEIKCVMLDPDSLQKIRDYHPTSPTLKQVKDLCLFQCFTGLRISDLMRLDKSHIVNSEGFYRVSMRALKTDKPMFIPLSEEALAILLKYDYKLPEFAEQYFNRQLKKLAGKAGLTQEIEWLAYDEQGQKFYKRAKIQELLSSHGCCRTAVDYFQFLGFTLPEISSILDKNMDTILTYYVGRKNQGNIIQSQKRLMSRPVNMIAA